MNKTQAAKGSVLYLRIPTVLHRQLKKTAALNRRTLTVEAQIAIERHVAGKENE